MSRTRFWNRSRNYRREILLQQLEERIVLDAAVTAAQDNPNDQAGSQGDAPQASDQAAAGDAAPDAAAGGGNAGLAPELPDHFDQVLGQHLNVVLVANDLADIEAISQAAQDHAQVITYDAEHDNLATITAKLQDLVTSTGQKIDNLAFVGHNSAGVLTVGTDQIQFFTLSNYQATLETLGQTLTQDAQIQFYGCYLAEDVWGEAMVDRIAIYTTADTFASTDASGGAAHDWTLEHASNAGVTMNPLFDSAALAAVTTELADFDLVANVNTATGAAPSNFVLVNGHVLFAATGAGTGAELWEYNPGTNTNTLFMDINPGAGSSSPTNLTVIGGNLYFNATSATGTDPWISDGTIDGTHIIKNFVTSSATAGSTYTEFNDEVYFSALNDSGARDLFKTNGTELGTMEVTTGAAQFANYPIVFDADGPGGADPMLYFVANDANGYELWKTNGTPGAETRVTDIAGTSTDIYTFGSTMTVLNNQLYFAANDGTNGVELWKTNGTFDTETQVVAGTGINATGSALGSGSYKPVVFNNELYFAATDGTTAGFFGTELWKTDGTTTTRVTDINVNQASSSPANLTVFNDGNGDKLYFTATNGAANGVELWRTDGTSPGTVMVADIGAGALNGINPGTAFLTVVGNSLYLQASDGGTAGLHGTELWKVTASGIADNLATTTVDESLTTQMVTDLSPGVGSSSPQNIANLGGTLYFGANNGAGGLEVFKSDGTTITQTPEINLLNVASNGPSNYFNVNGQVFFVADDGAGHGYELWVTDGTEAGTHLVKDILPGSNPINPGQNGHIANFTVFDNMLYFTAGDVANGSSAANVELWRSDGTADGTVQVADINTSSGIASSSPANLTVFQNKLYFTAVDTTANGTELWVYDGTNAPSMVANINAAANGSSSPANLTVFQNKLYFSAVDTTANGRELWVYDGTNAPTQVANINAAANGSSLGTGTTNNPAPNFTIFDNELYFVATNGTEGYELWHYDGTNAPGMVGTEIRPGTASAFGGWNVANPGPSLTVANDMLFFIANNGANGYELWNYDGVDRVMLTALSDANPFSTTTPQLTAYNNEVFFVASDGSFGAGVHGSELWKSDGTVAGTGMVIDINPGSGSGANAFGVPTFQTVNGTLYFTANDGVNGTALWATKGTEASTSMVSDIDPATNSGIYPRYLTAVGGTLYFSTTDAVNGPEPWALTNTPPTATNMTQSYTIADNSGPLNLADINLTDADPLDTFTANLILDLPAAGALSTSGTATYDSLTGVWTVSGTESEVEAALANVAFTPALNFDGTVHITTEVYDNALQGPADGLITVNVAWTLESESTGWGTDYWRHADGLGGYDVLFAYITSTGQYYQHEGPSSSPYGTAGETWYAIGDPGVVPADALLDGNVHALKADGSLTFQLDSTEHRVNYTSTLLGQFYYDFDHGIGDGVWYQKVGPGATDWAQAGETEQVWFQYGPTPNTWNLGNGLQYEYSDSYQTTYWRHADGLGGYDILFAYAQGTGQWYQHEGVGTSPYGTDGEHWYALGGAGATYGLLDANTHQVEAGLTFSYDGMQHRANWTSTLLGQFYYDYDHAAGDGLWYQKVGPGATDWAQGGETETVWFQYGPTPNTWNLGNGLEYEFSDSYQTSYWRHADGLGGYDILFAYIQGTGQWYQHEGVGTSPYGTDGEHWYTLGGASATYGLLDASTHQVEAGLSFSYDGMQHRANWTSDLLGQFYYDYDHAVGDGLWYQYQSGSATWLSANETEQVWFQFGPDPYHWTLGSGFEYEYSTYYAANYWRDPIGGPTYNHLYAYDAGAGQWYEQTTPTTSPYGEGASWVAIASRPAAIG